MQNNYKTSRLELEPLTTDDAEFILELVNTPGWLKFIGERNVKRKEAAVSYIQKILDNPDVCYWVVRIKDPLSFRPAGEISPEKDFSPLQGFEMTNKYDHKKSIGVITFIKREYLDHPDIGFAFLPQYNKQGYGYEATTVVLHDIVKNPSYTSVLATTVRDNVNSIQLLEKLGLRFHKEIERDNETLLVYSVLADKLRIDQLTKLFFSIFTNKDQQQPDWSLIQTICFPETIIIKKNEGTETVYNLQTFIEPRKKILSDGTLTEFEEKEISEETKIIGNMAQRFSKYEKSGYLQEKHFHEYGNKFFQFVKTNNGWKINSVVWEDDVK